jgi:hypothetical protein
LEQIGIKGEQIANASRFYHWIDIASPGCRKGTWHQIFSIGHHQPSETQYSANRKSNNSNQSPSSSNYGSRNPTIPGNTYQNLISRLQKSKV